MSDIRITAVRTYALGSGDWATEPVRSGSPWLCTPISIFEDSLDRATEYAGPVSVVVVEVETDAGITGFGTCGAGNAGAADVVDQHFAPLVVGADPFDVELLWAKMYRSSNRFGRRGVAITAISGIDIALWDIMGKRLGVPVYELLGGRSKQSATAYASRLYALKDLDELADEARGYVSQGYRMMKQRFGFGPQDGPAGVTGNIALVRAVREAIGDDVVLAADAYMGWDVEYALKMERLLRPFGLAWIEEPLMPHDVRGYERLCRTTETPISHGEHCYTRWDFAELIDRSAAHILQPDVNRVGGITEARKIFAMAAARDLPVVPHSNELHNLHFTFSQLNCPFTEYFPDVALDRNTAFYEIFEGNPPVVGGEVTLATTPGLGYTVNRDALEKMTIGR